MLPTQQKPDLDESINVTEAHGRVIREAAACARENRLADNGIAPISLWAFVACGLVMAVAGGILTTGSPWFSYGATIRENYHRTAPPGTKEGGPMPKEALAAYSARGAKIYSSKCLGCHGPDAKGNGSTYPALAGSKWANGETERFAMIILNGLEGPVDDGKSYGVMPPQGIGMAPEELAGIMTYVRNNFGNTKGDIITVDMAKAALDVSAKRKNAGKSVNAGELEEHVKNLPGDALDPKTMCDPITLSPAKAAP